MATKKKAAKKPVKKRSGTKPQKPQKFSAVRMRDDVIVEVEVPAPAKVTFFHPEVGQEVEVAAPAPAPPQKYDFADVKQLAEKTEQALKRTKHD